MKNCRLIVPIVTLALCVSTASAQDLPGSYEVAETGTVEFGLFTHFTHIGQSPQFVVDDITGIRLDSRNTGGFGVRLGVFATPQWSVELDATGASPDLSPAGSADFRTLSARLNYNFWSGILGPRVSIILGGGVVRSEFKGGSPERKQSDWGASALAGGRLYVAGPFSIRGDVVADYIPTDLNVSLRVGASVLIGSRGIGNGGREDAGAAETQPRVEPPPTLPPAEPEPAPFEEDEAARAAALAGVDTIPLTRSIFFDYDQVAIRADAVPILETKVRWLMANPRLQLRIEGHADDRGQDEYNLSLSQRRAAETQAWLISRGIAAERLPIVGYGEEFRLCFQEPMTEPCHQMNRRSDFRIIRVGGARLVPPR